MSTAFRSAAPRPQYCWPDLRFTIVPPKKMTDRAHRLDRIEAIRPHQSWSMDFVVDQLFDGRRFRALTIVDNFSRKCLAIHAACSIKGEDVML